MVIFSVKGKNMRIIMIKNRSIKIYKLLLTINLMIKTNDYCHY